MKDETYFEDEDTVPDMLTELEPPEETPAAVPDLFEASTITLTIRYLPVKDAGGRDVVILAQQEGGIGLVELCRSISYAFLPQQAYEALHKLKARLTVAAAAKQPEVTIQAPKTTAKPTSKPTTKTISLFDL
jgi:hypothetical protein